MRQWIQLLTMLGGCALQISSQSPEKPSFNGSWVLQSRGSSEIYTFEHDAMGLRIIERVDDSLGKRTLAFEGAIDGLPHRQTVLGDELTLRAQWFGDSLIYEARWERSTGIFYNRRIMKLAGHDEIRALRTRFLPGPEESWNETWLRQSGK